MLLIPLGSFAVKKTILQDEQEDTSSTPDLAFLIGFFACTCVHNLFHALLLVSRSLKVGFDALISDWLLGCFFFSTNLLVY